MDLSKITSFAFQEKFSQIGQQLHDSQQCEALLDEARRELPLVDGLLGVVSDLDEISDQEKRSQVFNRIMHDVHFLITLWKLGVQNERAAQAPEAKDPPSAQSSLRLRRFGTN